MTTITMNLTQKMVTLCHAYLDGTLYPDCDAASLRQALVTLFQSARDGELAVFANHNENRDLVP
jgi:hypothetical protein